MKKSAATKIQETITTPSNSDVVYIEFLEDLQSISEDQTLSNIEKYDEVCSLVDDMREFLNDSVNIEKLKNGPFIGLEDIGETSDVEKQAHDTWYNEQIDNLNYEISLIDNELENLNQQNETVKSSSLTRGINARKIRELELEKKPLVTRLAVYKAKLSS